MMRIVQEKRDGGRENIRQAISNQLSFAKIYKKKKAVSPSRYDLS